MLIFYVQSFMAACSLGLEIKEKYQGVKMYILVSMKTVT